MPPFGVSFCKALNEKLLVSVLSLAKVGRLPNDYLLIFRPEYKGLI